MANGVDITADYLRSILDYDPESGIFTWRKLDGGDRQANARNARWAGKAAGAPVTNGYIQIRVSGRLYLAHRLVWLITHGSWPAGEIDHINGNRSDNRLCNLREATRAQNMRNRGRQANNAVGAKGAYFDKARGKFAASIRVDGKNKHLGFFDTVDHAAAAYAEAALTYHGEFAK